MNVDHAGEQPAQFDRSREFATAIEGSADRSGSASVTSITGAWEREGEVASEVQATKPGEDGWRAPTHSLVLELGRGKR